jgi:aminotransferase EvaB
MLQPKQPKQPHGGTVEPILPPAPRKIEHNYLPAQFADMEAIWAKIKQVVENGDFTLGKALTEFEWAMATYLNVAHVIGVNSGTDALILSLKALGIKGEVIVPAFTFIATVAAVELAGCKPVLCDVGNDFNIDQTKVEALVTSRTEAIIPVHWAGRPCCMTALRARAARHKLAIVEDACHAIGARYGAINCGAWGNAGAFSLHPLKNVNVWGDGGYISTNSDDLAAKLKRWRNHGLLGRNQAGHYGHNSRLDTVQAVVGSHVLGKLNWIIAKRRHNAALLAMELEGVGEFKVEPLEPMQFMTYYLFTGHAERRDELVAYLNNNNIDAKVHYPTPQHLQPAAAHLGYKRGDFPVAEYCCDSTISLPVHDFVTDEDVATMGGLIRKFYSSVRRGV